MSRIGDRMKTVHPSSVRVAATLNHSLYFCQGEGWDAREGVLFECKLVWARGKRALTEFVIRDVRGGLVATGQQEGFCDFKAGAGDGRSRM
ncbi:hypothetical protein M409DRAFT_21370 [Zasmidium cellare ATCC 36951]|uniref:Acyl-CoA thioesterase-like C-terminal domain-containing protein n=1 Tax=Zasmidium cellare ATCC 36951 TaxID=1080233 RepID=A0A6A6CNB3_ZASCE|nr:uncharacterized protein M409DRAFT_21370 [Zasmidium cellare ATCC 36951]KAF2168625.1 hypothetical protein M409DRAFT_21370 [Zasmidium cellare ATCC 36951]